MYFASSVLATVFILIFDALFPGTKPRRNKKKKG